MVWARLGATSCMRCAAQTATTADAPTRRSPRDRQRCAAASASASAAQASNFRPPRTRAGRRARVPEGGGRDAAQRPPRRLSRFGARAGRGRQGRDSRASRCLPPQNPPRAAPAPARRVGGAAGLRPSERPPSARRGAPPGPGAWGRRRAAGGARRGDYFRRPPAPRPLSSRGGTLRAALVAAGYHDSARLIRGPCAAPF